MKKVISLFLSLAMLLSIVSIVDFSAYADTLTTGKCGDNVTYSFDTSTGMLTISGKGNMYNYLNPDAGEYESPFYYEKITSVVINSGVTSIGNSSFLNLNLTSITIPNSVTEIGESAFSACRSLTSVTIPDSVTSIGDWAFSGCYFTSENFVNNSNVELDDSSKPTIVDTDAGGFCIKDNVLVNMRPAYAIGEITIPNSVTSIDSSAFYCCSSLTSVTIPNSVISIGEYAFCNCTSLTSVTIPSSVKRLGDNALGSVKKVIYNGTDKEFFEIENIENNKNVIVAKYYDLLNDLISEIEVPYKQSEYLKITDDYLYNTIKDRINNNEEARSKKISIKNGEFYINGMDIGELEVQYVYFPQHYYDLNGNIESLHKVYCYISSYSMDVKVKFINDSDYNKADEKYVSDFIKTLNIAKPQCYEVDYEEYKMSEIGDWKYNFSVASEYYNKLINDSSIKFVAGSGAGGYCSFLNPGFSEAGVDLAVFKNDVLYGTYYPITNYKDGVNITEEMIIPVMTLPSDLPDNQVENYILQKLKNDWKNESDTILSVKKGAVVNGSQLKDGYVIKIAPGYYEGDYGIIIARKQNNSTSDEKPTPVPTPSPAHQVTQSTAHNDTATTLQAKNTVSKPKSTNTKKIKAAKKAILVTWKKVSGVKGYQVQVATDKKFKKNKKTVNIKKQKTTKTTIKKLKAKKKYYVRVRTYKIVNGKKVYSSWSKVESVKTK